MNIQDITTGDLTADLSLLAEAGKPTSVALPTVQSSVVCRECGYRHIQARWFPTDHWLYPLLTQVAAAYSVFQAERLIELSGQKEAWQVKKVTPCACEK
jgi:hypothetical protein